MKQYMVVDSSTGKALTDPDPILTEGMLLHYKILYLESIAIKYRCNRYNLEIVEKGE